MNLSARRTARTAAIAVVAAVALAACGPSDEQVREAAQRSTDEAQQAGYPIEVEVKSVPKSGIEPVAHAALGESTPAQVMDTLTYGKDLIDRYKGGLGESIPVTVTAELNDTKVSLSSHMLDSFDEQVLTDSLGALRPVAGFVDFSGGGTRMVAGDCDQVTTYADCVTAHVDSIADVYADFPDDMVASGQHTVQVPPRPGQQDDERLTVTGSPTATEASQSLRHLSTLYAALLTAPSQPWFGLHPLEISGDSAHITLNVRCPDSGDGGATTVDEQDALFRDILAPVAGEQGWDVTLAHTCRTEDGKFERDERQLTF